MVWSKERVAWRDNLTRAPTLSTNQDTLIATKYPLIMYDCGIDSHHYDSTNAPVRFNLL